MVSRVDTLLEELAARHGADPQFMARLRPLVEQVFDDQTPESSRVELLELVAETCERHVVMRRDFTALRAGVQNLFDDLARLVQEAMDRDRGGS